MELWKERDGQIGRGLGLRWGWEVEGQARGHESEGQERAQIVLWAIAFPHQHLNSGSICITLHMREEHPRVGSADRLRVAQTGFKSRSLEPSPDPFVLLQISHGPGVGLSPVSVSSTPHSKGPQPTSQGWQCQGWRGCVVQSLLGGVRFLLGVSECAREPGDLSEDSREPPALSRPYLGLNYSRGGGFV